MKNLLRLITSKYAGVPEQVELRQQYERCCRESSDIHEHMPVLRALANECNSVIEIGLRTMTSTWGILQGLQENPSSVCSYLGVDLVQPPEDILDLARRLAEANGISFRFWQANDMDIELEPADMLFIDSKHTYCHLTYELETFSSKIQKYIAMHDTDEPWGYIDDFQVYHGDKSEYPASIDRNRVGLWAAVEDFLKRHPEWVLQERRLNNHGFTILKRISV